MSKPKPSSKTLAKIKSQAKPKMRGWLANLTPEERATCEAIRREHLGPNGPLNLTATLAILREDFGKRVVSMRTFGPWINSPDRDGKVTGFSTTAEGSE